MGWEGGFVCDGRWWKSGVQWRSLGWVVGGRLNVGDGTKEGVAGYDKEVLWCQIK